MERDQEVRPDRDLADEQAVPDTRQKRRRRRLRKRQEPQDHATRSVDVSRAARDARRKRIEERDRERERERGASSEPPRTKRAPRQHRRPVADAIGRWWDRLLGVASSGGFDKGASEYDRDQAGADYVLNTAGLGAWGMLFPVLSIVATQLAGAQAAGMFSMAFSTATLMLYVGNYGVRTYQVSDIDEADSFASYQVHRLITCAVMLLICGVWCAAKGYDRQMCTIFWGAFAFRATDALADTYEARLQQMGKLYLAGISVAVRSILGIACFSVVLFVTKNLALASVGMAAIAVASLLLLTVPLAFLETPKSRAFDVAELQELFEECFPAFAAQFLFALIETMPKFAMEGVLPYEDQVFFNAIYFPAQSILMIVGFVYKPQLVRIAGLWADRGKRARFDLVVSVTLIICVAVTIIMLLAFAWVGIWLNGLMYGVDFEPYRAMQYLMICAGGFSAAIDFLYQVITVARRQAQATATYLVAFLLMALSSVVGVRMVGFDGAVWSYLVVMVALFLMLGAQFLLIRLRTSR